MLHRNCLLLAFDYCNDFDLACCRCLGRTWPGRLRKAAWERERRDWAAFQAKLERRRARRVAASREETETADAQLASLASEALAGRAAWVRCGPAIVGLLDRGATLSHLSDHELRGPNLGDFVDFGLEDDDRRTPEQYEAALDLLDEVVASPVPSWATHRRYVMNGGRPLVYFVINSVLVGGPWGRLRPSLRAGRTHVAERTRCLLTLKRMVLAAELEAQSSGAPLVSMFPGVPGPPVYLNTLFQILASDSRRCAKGGGAAECHLQVELMRFLSGRTGGAARLLEPGTSFRLTTPWAMLWLLAVPGRYCSSLAASVDVAGTMDALSGCREHRREVLRLLSSHRPLRLWCLEARQLGEICRRRERRVLEVLVQFEALETVRRLPMALGLLASSGVRGKKERIIGLLSQMQSAARQKALALQELRALRGERGGKTEASGHDGD